MLFNAHLSYVCMHVNMQSISMPTEASTGNGHSQSFSHSISEPAGIYIIEVCDCITYKSYGQDYTGSTLLFFSAICQLLATSSQ